MNGNEEEDESKKVMNQEKQENLKSRKR